MNEFPSPLLFMERLQAVGTQHALNDTQEVKWFCLKIWKPILRRCIIIFHHVPCFLSVSFHHFPHKNCHLRSRQQSPARPFVHSDHGQVTACEVLGYVGSGLKRWDINKNMFQNMFQTTNLRIVWMMGYLWISDISGL